jgi:hypothetical protein
MRAAAAATGAIGSSSEAGFASHSATPIRDSDGGRVCTRASARSWMHQRPAKGHDRPAGGELAPPLRLRGDSKCTRSRAPRAGGGGLSLIARGRATAASQRRAGDPRGCETSFFGEALKGWRRGTAVARPRIAKPPPKALRRGRVGRALVVSRLGERSIRGNESPIWKDLMKVKHMYLKGRVIVGRHMVWNNSSER